jgi:O-acetyl-ADP-ribose deacetylase (regulator of RNase III)
MYCYINGNIFESPAQTIVNTVNTVGVMGKGLAGTFKILLPEMFEKYQKLCEKGKISIGSLWLYRTPNKFVLNFPTKEHWRHPSKLEYIEIGLSTFSRNYEKANINSIAFPMLGCGNGELRWEEVRPLMESYLSKLPIDIYVYKSPHQGPPEHRDIEAMRKWLMTEPQYYPFEEFKTEIYNLLKYNPNFIDIYGNNFGADANDTGISLINSSIEAYLPWRGDDLSNGLMEFWQLFREKGICTLENLAEMGLPLPECLMGILVKLPYIRLLPETAETDKKVFQLIAVNMEYSQLPLFYSHEMNKVYDSI